MGLGFRAAGCGHGVMECRVLGLGFYVWMLALDLESTPGPKAYIYGIQYMTRSPHLDLTIIVVPNILNKLEAP